jgi:hypothetical protein
MTVVNPPYDTNVNPPFLGLYTEEDMGLKTLLQGVTVTDLNAAPGTPRPVPVWFHNPEREERRITYPNITINFLGERVAHEREHRGRVQVYYRYLQNIPLADNLDYPAMMEYPIPLDFDYTVTASARINQHISQMSYALVMNKLHPRFAQMECPGGTVRRITVMGVSRTNSMEVDKRLFRQVYQLRVSTEVEDPVSLLTTRVRHIALTIMEMYSDQVLWGPGTVNAIHNTSQLPDSIPGQSQVTPRE